MAEKVSGVFVYGLRLFCPPCLPAASPKAPFRHTLSPRFFLFPSSLSPENAQNKNIRLQSPFNKCPNRKFKQHMDQLCACTDQWRRTAALRAAGPPLLKYQARAPALAGARTWYSRRESNPQRPLRSNKN